MKRYIKNIIPAALMAFSVGMMTSCTSDLDVTPIDPNLDLLTPESVPSLFNKCYANITLAGNSGPDGDCDINGLDGGTTGMVRQMFNINELPTDEAICCWGGDPGIPDFNFNTYDASHPMVKGYYYRLYSGITLCNHYLSVAADYDATMTAEIRFLRAFYYYLAMDAFGNIPFTTEVSSAAAPQYTRAQVYEFIESELLDIESSLSQAKAKNSSDPMYGRVDQAGCWFLLMRLYLNAEVYTGTAQWQKAADYAKKVIDSPYKLNTTSTQKWTAYQMLFMGDNGESAASSEAVFPILGDGMTTASYGTFYFLMASTFIGDMMVDPSASTVNGSSDGSWGGNRARPELIAKFFPNGDAPDIPSYDMIIAAGDDRAIFWGLDRTLSVDDISAFKSGYSVAKFMNHKSDGSAGHDAKFPDGDFFMFRVAEAYLTYAEATAHLNGNMTTTEGTKYVNDIRTRAHAATNSRYTLDELCDEWSREFYFEGRRRTDLVRFGKYGGNTNYTWQWKGGVKEGINFSSTKNIYAIPTDEIIQNSNLVQNPGY